MDLEAASRVKASQQNRISTNFGYLQEHDEQLVLLGLLTARYFADDPNACLIKLRQLAEALAQTVASGVGCFLTPAVFAKVLRGELVPKDPLEKSACSSLSELKVVVSGKVRGKRKR